jgi:hypothetical protein
VRRTIAAQPPKAIQFVGFQVVIGFLRAFEPTHEYFALIEAA